MDPAVKALLRELKELAEAGVISQAACEAAQQGLLPRPWYGPTGLPTGYKIEVNQMLSVGVLGGGAVQSQPQL